MEITFWVASRYLTSSYHATLLRLLIPNTTESRPITDTNIAEDDVLLHAYSCLQSSVSEWRVLHCSTAVQLSPWVDGRSLSDRSATRLTRLATLVFHSIL